MSKLVLTRLRLLLTPARAAAIVVAGLVLLAGIVYATARTPSWTSTSTLVLVPATASAKDAPTVIDGFTAGGTSGTFVEFLASPDLLTRAGSPPVSVAARAVPDTRVIDVTATGDATIVRASLARFLAAAQSQQSSLGDVWRLREISAPSVPVRAGASPTAILGASLLLALVAAAALLAVLGRMGAGARPVGRALPLEPVLDTPAESRPPTRPTRAVVRR
jgi:hypothetical protein